MAYPIPSGEMRHQVIHQKSVPTTDDFGQPSTNSWVDVTTYWAKVTPLNGRELVNAAQIRADVSHKVEMRFQGANVLYPQDRFSYDGRILNIAAVQNVDEMNHTWLVYCTESKIQRPPT